MQGHRSNRIDGWVLPRRNPRAPVCSGRLARLLLGLLVLLMGAACNRAPAEAVSRVKLLVEADGVYQVTAGDLLAVGFDLAAAGDDLTLSAGGQPVAFELTGKGNRRVLRFYGQALGPEAYTSTNVYWLARERSTGSDGPDRIAAGQETVAPGVGATEVVTASVIAEEQRRHLANAAEGADRWTWESLFAPADFEVKLDVPGPAAGEASLSVYVIGDSQAETNPDHRLTLTLNGTRVADATWDGMGPHIITATVPSGVLLAGQNILQLHAPGDTGAPADAIILDRVALTYPRELALTRDELFFEGSATAYVLKTRGRPALLWDITDPDRPVALPAAPEGDRLMVEGDGIPRRFVIVTDAGIRKPAAIVPAGSPAARLPGAADLLIVTVPQFHEALQPLVEARRAQGLRVAVVDVAEVNDVFNDGRSGPEGIRRLVQHAVTTWAPPAPRFLLLAGDASYDPRGYLKGPEADLVPTQEVYTTFSGWTASDVWYAMPDDSLAAKPRLAVGRLPAQTAEQLTVMVAKTLEYERTAVNADWRKSALLVADNDEQGFAQEAGEFAQRLDGYTANEVTISGDGSAARRALLAGFDGGTGLIGYFGHGSVVLWAQEKVFANDDVAKLTNRERLPIVFTVTCLSGFFSHPTTPSLGETLLRADNGGAVAALVPSSAAILSDQRLLARNLADALGASASGDPATLGEAVQRAQMELPEKMGGVREILLTFNLLGDPALRLGR